MKLTGCEGELLRRLAEMPFLDRMDLAAVSGWSKGAVYRGVRRLEEGGLAAPVPHATDLIPLTGRFHLTAAGLRLLAQWDGMSVDELLRTRPVSARWRRILLERLDAVAAVYRLASAVSNIAYPMRFRWYRAAPMDAAIELSGGRTLAVVRQGLAAARTGFAKRVWRLWEGPIPAQSSCSCPTRRGCATPAGCSRALPRPLCWRWSATRSWPQAASASGICHPSPQPSTWGRRWTGYGRAALFRWNRSSRKRPSPGTFPPSVRGGTFPTTCCPPFSSPPRSAPSTCSPDWPWISRKDLAGLMDVSEPRVSQLVTPLEGFGLAARLPADEAGVPGPGRLLALTDGGLAVLARRDRASVGVARRRWSVTPEDPEAPLSWRNVSGAGSRQLLRNVEHTTAVHGFIAALARQSRSLGWKVVQIDPRGGRRGTSGTAACPRGRAGCAPSTPTPSASCAGAGPRGPSSWSGSAAPCGPRRWRNGSPHTCATTPPAAPSTTTAHSPPSSSSSTTTWRRPTSCEWQGRRWTGPGSESPCGSPTGGLSTPWGLWDGPGALPATGSPPTSSRCAEYPARDESGAAALAPP